MMNRVNGNQVDDIQARMRVIETARPLIANILSIYGKTSRFRQYVSRAGLMELEDIRDLKSRGLAVSVRIRHPALAILLFILKGRYQA